MDLKDRVADAERPPYGLRDHCVERPPTAERLIDPSVSEANGPSVSVTNGLTATELRSNSEQSERSNSKTLTYQLVDRLFGSLAYDYQTIHH